MATRTKPVPDTRDEPQPEVLGSLGDDRGGLLDEAMAVVLTFDGATMRGDGVAAELASRRYLAIIWKLNGGTNFGCMAHEESAGCVVERHCAALPGAVPKWGQRGQFLCVESGVRSLVEYEPAFGRPLSAHFQFHAIDLDGPFVSETGYRSHFGSAVPGMTVQEVARGIMRTLLERKRLVHVNAGARERLAGQALPAWLGGLAPHARRTPATQAVPSGFVLVDVVLPAHKAYIARKWADDAAAKIKALSEKITDQLPPPTRWAGFQNGA